MTRAINVLTIGAMLGALAIAAAYCTGCNESARVVQLDVAHGSAVVLNTATDVLTAARDREMDAAEAAHPSDPEHDEAIDAVARRWEPVAIAMDLCRRALLEWIAEASRAEDDNESTLARILSYAQRLVRLYEDVRERAETLGVELPAIPPALLALLGASDTSANTARSVTEDLRAFIGPQLGMEVM